MKKLFFTLTIVAAGLIVSCGHKEMAAGMDSTNVADTTEKVDSVSPEVDDTATLVVDSVESKECVE